MVHFPEQLVVMAGVGHGVKLTISRVGIVGFVLYAIDYHLLIYHTPCLQI